MKAAWRTLVRLFPRAFRERFAREMLEQVEQDYRRAKSKGGAAAAWFVLATTIDLLRTAVSEHWTRTWVPPLAEPKVRRGMRSTLDHWLKDFGHSLRALRRTPGFTIVAVTTLGIAIGATAGMFSVVNTVLLQPLPYANADRLVHIGASAPGSDFPAEFGVSNEFYVQYKEQSKLLEDVATYSTGTSTLRAGDRVERIRMSWPAYTLFSTLGAKPILGRLPVAEDDDRVALISHQLWQTWFSGDPGVIGRTYDISGDQRTVIGVMGPEFQFPLDGTLLWIPSTIRPEGIQTGRFGNDMVARVAPGVSMEALKNELNTLARRLPERFGGSPAYARLMGQHRALVVPLEKRLFGQAERPLWVLLGAAAIVLLIACANVANLFLVRGEGNQRDMAVRRAIGAARGQLVRLQLTEALVVAAFAGGLAVVLAAITLPAFLRAAPQDVPRLADAHVTAATFLFTATAAVLAALACGFVPALRGSAPDLRRLREGTRGNTSRRHLLRDLLVVGQTGLALVLLIGSALLVRSFWSLQHVDPGYVTDDIFTFQIAPEQQSLKDGPSYARFWLNLADRLEALPGVQSVGIIENVPLNEGTRGVRFRAEGRANDEGSLLQMTFAGGDYFKTMGIAVLAGRPFRLEDHRPGQFNVVISRTAAGMLWPTESAVGRRLLTEMDSVHWATVVGVVEDVMQDSFRDSAQPLVYLPLVGPTANSYWLHSPAFVLKTARAETIATEVRAVAHEVAPEAPFYRVFTMAGLARDSMVPLSFTMLTLGFTALLALLLGALGLYGVLSYVVAQRTREIGVRMALGAKAEQVRLMVVAQGARVVGIGVVVGVAAALATTRVLGSLLFGVAPVHIATFAGMSATMIAIGLLASYLPARRASNVDPIESLRGD